MKKKTPCIIPQPLPKLCENTKFKTLPLQQLFSQVFGEKCQKQRRKVGDGFATRGSSIGELTSSQEKSCHLSSKPTNHLKAFQSPIIQTNRPS